MSKSLVDDDAPIPSAYEEETIDQTQVDVEERNQEAQANEMAQEPEAAVETAEASFDSESNAVPVEDGVSDYSEEQNTVTKITRKQEQAAEDFERDYLSAQGQADPMAVQGENIPYRQQTQISEVDPENDPRNIKIYLQGAHNPNSRFRNTRPYEMVLAKFETPLEHEIANLSTELINQATDLVGDDSVMAQIAMADLQGWIMPMRAKHGFEREMEVTSINKSHETKKFAKQQKQDKTGFGLDSFKRQREE